MGMKVGGGKKSEASCLNEMLRVMISLDRWGQLIVFCCISPTRTRRECHFYWRGSNIGAGNLAILGGHQHPRHGHHRHLILDKYKTSHYAGDELTGPGLPRDIQSRIFFPCLIERVTFLLACPLCANAKDKAKGLLGTHVFANRTLIF